MKKVLITIVRPTAGGWDIETQEAGSHITPRVVEFRQVKSWLQTGSANKYAQRFFNYEGEEIDILISTAKTRAKILMLKHIETVDQLLEANK